MRFGFVVIMLLSLPYAASAESQPGHGGAAASPYAGQESRPIKSLSADDIAELRRGGGWGLAKPAELNGMPGPAHVLELREKLELSAEQAAAIEAVKARMQAEAIAEGKHLIVLETELESAFRAHTMTEAGLRHALAEIEHSRAALRYIHLAAHLATPALLHEAQIRRYAMLRGYASDACAAVPEGHDPALWRRHNGCTSP